MKIYVDEQKRYEDTKATGQCFTGVGAIGLIAIVLIYGAEGHFKKN